MLYVIFYFIKSLLPKLYVRGNFGYRTKNNNFVLINGT